MREEIFNASQLRLIKKFEWIFHLESHEVVSEAWLVLADLEAQGRNLETDFNSVLWGRLKNIYRGSGMWANAVLASSVEAITCRQLDSEFHKEALIGSLPEGSKAAANIELFSGCRSARDVAEKNNWSLAAAKRYVAAAIAEAESGYVDDFFEPKHDENWRPARTFKKCKLTELATDLHFDEGEEDADEVYFDGREAA